MRATTKWGRFPRTAKLTSWLVLLALASLLVPVSCAYTPPGRRLSANLIETVVSRAIPGVLQIGELSRLGLHSLEARDVRFLHPDGRCVLRVDNARVETSLADALRGRLVFRHAVADGGSMLFSVDPDGRLSFEAAVSSPSAPGQMTRAEDGLHYDLRDMRVERFQLDLALSEDSHYRFSGVSGTVHVHRLDTPAAHVALREIRGSISPRVAGARISAKRIDGVVKGDARTVADMRAHLIVDGDSALKVRVLYAPKAEERVKLRVIDKTGASATTLSWLLHLAASFTGDLRVDG